jgi:two-component system copper resistance phosphate regulon response regulator CusR
VLIYCASPDKVVTREILAKDVWRETNRTSPLDNVIDVHVGQLRRKIDEDNAIKLIYTVRGVRFTLQENAATALMELERAAGL